jgi:hypothetical protein
MPPFTKQLLNRHAQPRAIISPRLREWFEPEARQTPDRPFAQRGLLNGGDAAALTGVRRSGEFGMTMDYSAPPGNDVTAGSDVNGEYDTPDHGTLGPARHGHYQDSMDATQPVTTRTPNAAMPGQQPQPNLTSKTNRIPAAASPIAYPNSGTLRKNEGLTGTAADSSDPGRAGVNENSGAMETPGENAAPPTVQPSGLEALSTPLAKGRIAPDSATHVQPVTAGRLNMAFPRSSRPIHQQTTPNNTTVIKVSIGRIEIKAITQPQPPAAKRREPQKPKLSLDDFLSSRKSSQP